MICHMFFFFFEKQGRHILDAVHPFVLLLSRGGRDAVEGVVALHHATVGLRLAGFDHLVFVVGDEKLKAVLRRTERPHTWGGGGVTDDSDS